MKIAAIILNYNSAEDCKKCISFLKEQEGVELDVIVVDNASKPEELGELKFEVGGLKFEVGGAPLNLPEGETLEVGESLGAIRNITLIEAEENRGYNAGNNIGLRYAAEKGYKYALICNPDMEFPDKEYVKKMVSGFEVGGAARPPKGEEPPSPKRGNLKSPLRGDLEGLFHNSSNSHNFYNFPGEKVGDKADASIVVVGSDIVTPEGIHQNPMLPDGDWKSSFGWIKGFLKRNKKQDKYDFIGNYKESGYCSKVSGCALMVDLDFIKSIGYFDEYPFLYCEEAILAKQVERAGRKMFYTAETTAIHRHIKSEKGDPRPRFRQWNRSRQYYIRKYADYPWYGRLLASLSFWSYTMMLIGIVKIKKIHL